VRDLDPASFPGRSLRPGALLGGIVAEVVRRSREQRPGSDTEPWVRHVLRRTLEEEGLELYLNRSMPCGDAGIALGQVWSMVARGF
jgi:hypothetical protein